MTQSSDSTDFLGHWIGVRDNLQETPIFGVENHGSL